MKAFSFNSEAKYSTGEVYKPKTPAPKLFPLSIQITTEATAGFEVRPPDILGKYKLPNINFYKLVHVWQTNNMQFFRS